MGGRQLARARPGHERLLNRRVPLVVGNCREHFQLFRLEIFFRRPFDGRVFAFEETIEPAEHRQLQVLRILVRAFGDEQAEVRACAVKPVDLAYMTVQSHDAIERKNGVLVRVADQQRPRRDHRR